MCEHPEYKQDSVVSEKINYDLLIKLSAISEGECQCEDLIGKISSRAQSQRSSLPRRISVRTDTTDDDDDGEKEESK